MNATPSPHRSGMSAPAGVGALPSSLRFRGLTMTGQFLHDPENKRDIFFQGEGDVPRSFTVLIALGYKTDNLDLGRNGIAIIDNDNWRIVADACHAQASGLKGASAEQRRALEEICAFGWEEFASFCRTRETYRAGSGDIDIPGSKPAAGNAERQVKLGLRIHQEPDIRSDFIRGIHETGDYNLPRTTRRGMINDILMHPSQESRNGRTLAWDTRMNFSWDRSGRVEGGEEVCRSMDARWMAAVKEDDDLLRKACDEAFSPYLAEGFAALGLEEATCEIVAGGPEGEHLLLKSFRGTDLEFRDHRDLRQKIEALSEEDISNLWVTVRVLDKDLSRASRANEVQIHLNSLRAEKEQEWLVEADEEIAFVV
ncbi:hypothetical protein [Defluviimonas salinarum]|uniref:Uncharacterized protein n=1 Tax=Defluviimonas salinarum TaxID=2992147 RepID=A0ABT3J9R2_9RHOB|nr:hypothetical protein [Defluviimonas salinarum]MCW3784432.1 hypothetical protein [Defluviimonas salinarum]